jgi:Lrp/AsnC family transcriptional regulator for asnA, asnC and gidA
MKSKKFLDSTSKFIISELQKDGRLKFTALAKKLNITPAAAKERVERLLGKKIIKISALINTQNLFPITSAIGIEADSEGVNILVRKLRNCPLIFHMTKTSGNHNLVISMVSRDISQMEDFLNKQIRSEPGIRHVEVNLGNATIVPEYFQLRMITNPKENDIAPCGIRRGEVDQCVDCPALTSEER